MTPGCSKYGKELANRKIIRIHINLRDLLFLFCIITEDMCFLLCGFAFPGLFFLQDFLLFANFRFKKMPSTPCQPKIETTCTFLFDSLTNSFVSLGMNAHFYQVEMSWLAASFVSYQSNIRFFFHKTQKFNRVGFGVLATSSEQIELAVQIGIFVIFCFFN